MCPRGVSRITNRFRNIANVEYEDKHWTRSHLDVFPSMNNPEAALFTSQEPIFETVRTDANEYIPILTCKMTLSDESQPSSVEVVANADDETIWNMRFV